MGPGPDRGSPQIARQLDRVGSVGELLDPIGKIRRRFASLAFVAVVLRCAHHRISETCVGPRKVPRRNARGEDELAAELRTRYASDRRTNLLSHLLYEGLRAASMSGLVVDDLPDQLRLRIGRARRAVAHL